jgi:hypothetical protein
MQNSFFTLYDCTGGGRRSNFLLAWAWSKDGKRIVYARGKFRNDLVLIENF